MLKMFIQNYRSAEEIVQDDEDDVDGQKNTVEALQKKLEQTAILCQSLLGDQQAAGQLARQSASGNTCLPCKTDNYH